MNRYEQVIHMDMNWNDEQTTEEMDARNAEARLKAETVATLIRDPSKGVHTEAYETLTGWAVLVTHNVMTISESELKRRATDTGYMWHRNAINHNDAREVLLADGMSCDDVDRLVANADRKNPDVIVDR